MSIYCSFGDIGDTKPTTPLVYIGSNVLPSRTNERRGYVSLAFIPPHIGRKRDNDGRRKTNHPYLRLSVSSQNDTAGATVILTRKQVQSLRDDLTWWLESLSGGNTNV